MYNDYIIIRFCSKKCYYLCMLLCRPIVTVLYEFIVTHFVQLCLLACIISYNVSFCIV